MISALSDAVLVIEARARSGSLITADFALEQGKDVYALPGRITDALSYGTNQLIRQGAYPIVSVEELLTDLKVKGVHAGNAGNTKEPCLRALPATERTVYEALEIPPKGLEELLEKTDLSIPALSAALDGLIKKHLAEEGFPGAYRRLY